MDVKHKFKAAKKRVDSKYAACPNFIAGVAKKQQIIADIRRNGHHCYFVPTSKRNELQVHRDVFTKVFNVGKYVISRCKGKRFKDCRKKKSGRPCHQNLRAKIERFWNEEVETEPSHYCATSTKLRVVDVNSARHGWLIFLARHHPEQYQRCVEAMYFPGMHRRTPEFIPPENLPIMACDACIQRAADSKVSQIVCSHVSKLTFFLAVTRTFNLGFKRPGTDQCEKCNTLHDRIMLYRAMGRHDEADAHEDKLEQHEEELSNHHMRAAAFRAVMNELQHTSKTGSGSRLHKYTYDRFAEWSSRDIIQSISMDAGSGLRTPACRVGFAYFSRVLVTNVYHIVDHGSLDRQRDHVYLWNDRIGGKGPEECMSIFLAFIQSARTGAKRLVIEVDGCGGQVFNQFFFCLCAELTDPTTDICHRLGASPGRPIFDRIDIFRGEVGHTFMAPDRKHGIIRRACRREQHVASIEEYEQLIKKCNNGGFNVTRIKSGDGFFKDMKKYVRQSHKVGGSHTDIDGDPISTRARHWVNFGWGPSGGPHNRITRHKYGAWRMRTSYDPAEYPCEIVIGRHTQPRRTTGEYVFPDSCVLTLGDFQRRKSGFISFDSRRLAQKWSVDREIPLEKVRDTHKLACLGLSEDKIGLWPCPDPETCKLDRCPERVRVIVEVAL